MNLDIHQAELPDLLRSRRLCIAMGMQDRFGLERLSEVVLDPVVYGCIHGHVGGMPAEFDNIAYIGPVITP